MGTHCLTEVTSKNIMKFWPLQLFSSHVFAPFWPCLIQCPIHTHMPCLMNPGMLHLHMVEPSVESRFKHTVDHLNLEMAMTLLLHGFLCNSTKGRLRCPCISLKEKIGLTHTLLNLL